MNPEREAMINRDREARDPRLNMNKRNRDNSPRDEAPNKSARVEGHDSPRNYGHGSPVYGQDSPSTTTGKESPHQLPNGMPRTPLKAPAMDATGSNLNGTIKPRLQVQTPMGPPPTPKTVSQAAELILQHAPKTAKLEAASDQAETRAQKAQARYDRLVRQEKKFEKLEKMATVTKEQADNELESKRGQYQDHVQKDASVASQLEAVLAGFVQTHAAKQGQNAIDRQEFDALVKQNQQQDRVLAEYKQHMDEQKRSAEAMRSLVEEQKKELKALHNGRVSKLDLEAMRSEVTKQHASLSSELKRANSSASNTHNIVTQPGGLKDKVKGLQDSLFKVEGNLDECTKRLGKVELRAPPGSPVQPRQTQPNDGLANRVRDLESQTNKLKNSQTSLEKKTTELQQKTTALEGKANAAKLADEVSRDKREKELELYKARSAEQQDALSRRLDDLATSNARPKAQAPEPPTFDVTALAERVETLELLCSDEQQGIHDQLIIDSATQTINGIEEQVKALAADIKTLQEKSDEQPEAPVIDPNQGKVDELRADINRVKFQIELLQSAHPKSNGAHSESQEQTNRSFRDELNGVKVSVQHLDHRYNNLTTEEVHRMMNATLAAQFPGFRDSAELWVSVDKLQKAIDKTDGELRAQMTKVLQGLTGLDREVKEMKGRNGTRPN